MYLTVGMCHKFLLVFQEGPIEAGIRPLTDDASSVQNLNGITGIIEDQHIIIN